MTISRAQISKELTPGLNALFGDTYKAYEQQHLSVFSVENSQRAFEEEQMLSGFGAAPTKSEGSAIQMDSAGETYTSRYTHETIALGYALTEEAFEDNLYARQGARYTKALARAMAHTKQVKGAAVLNNAFSATHLGGDGVALLSTSHPLRTGGVLANTPAVQADLNETSLESALTAIAGFVDERGLLIALKGMKLVIPRQLQFVATRLLMSELRSGVADNDTNAIRSMSLLPQGHCVMDYLTDPDAWFVQTDVPNGMQHFVRVKLQNGQDGDFLTGNYLYKARERYSFGWSDARCMYGSSGMA